ncbi:MAG: YqgE/AlgH family protein [Thalassobaculum sp.]|uniref:YqgE/AlgH family protein n=1 Tax=Thalassobaculum sp. TaxID=2022740 RepID=UPI0032EEDF75
MSDEATAEGYLAGQILIAMPSMSDPRFARTVIYLCAHNADGAMGLVLNRLISSITFKDLLDELKVEEPAPEEATVPAIHFGGPVETGRGFVLHSADYVGPDSMPLTGTFALTATVDILKAIAAGQGPEQHLLALGYAGWGPGQLDGELQENAWLSVEADPDLVFDGELDDKWERALAKLGISASLLSSDAGHA